MKHFVQFYNTISYMFDDRHAYTNFQNGLSHVWRNIENRDWKIYWVSDDSKEPPIKEGDLFVSCWHTKEVELVKSWDKKYQDLNAYVCGPIILHYGMNVKSIRGNAEDIFFDGQTSEWKLDMPKVDTPVGYSVSITKGTGCYWGKCTFCKVVSNPKYRDINNIPIIDHPYHKYIWLHTFALPSTIINKLYPTFPDRNDVTYMSYIRADKQSISAYKNILPRLQVDPKYLAFDLGVEFPSNRMLEYMKKGTTISNYLDFIKITTGAGSRLHFNFILNWKNLTEQDIYDTQDFFDKLSSVTDGSNITINIYPLIVIGDKEIFSYYKPEELIFKKKSIWDIELDVDLYYPKLTKKQILLNEKARKIFHSFPFIQIHDWVQK